MPDSQTHSGLTRAALELQETNTGENTRLIEEYCSWPDSYFSSRHNEVKPYMFFTDGIQFHYPPDTPCNDLYRYWDFDGEHFFRSRPFVNENFLHVTKGFFFYIEKILYHFRKEALEEGKKYLGCLLHFLEDSSFGLHALEGAYGGDAFFPDRLTDGPVKPSALIAKLKWRHDFPPVEYAPRSLGNSVEEFVMKLYAAYCKVSSDSRKCCFAYMMNALQNDTAPNRALEDRMYLNTVRLCADVIGTCFQLAQGKKVSFGPFCRLGELEPFEYPFGGFGPFRFTSFTRDHIRDDENRTLPLTLDCGTFDHGIAFGSHHAGRLLYHIAPGTFSRFRCRLGMHTHFPVTGEITFQIINDGQTLDTVTLTETHTSCEISVPEPANEFGVSFVSTPRCGAAVLGDPVLDYTL